MIEKESMESISGRDPNLIGISSELLLDSIEKLQISWEKIRRRHNEEFSWEEILPDEKSDINDNVREILKVALVPGLQLTSLTLDPSLFVQYKQRKNDLRKELKEIVRNSTSNRDDLTLALVHLTGGVVNVVMGEYEKAINDIHFETALWANESLKNKVFDLMANYFLSMCNFQVLRDKKEHDANVYYRNVLSRSDKVLELMKEEEWNETSKMSKLYSQLCATKVQEFKYKAESEIARLGLRGSYGPAELMSKRQQAVPAADYRKRLETVAEELINDLYKNTYREEIRELEQLKDIILNLVEKELSSVYDKEEQEDLKHKLSQLLNRVIKIAPEELSNIHQQNRDKELDKLKKLLRADLTQEELQTTISTDPRIGILLGHVYRKIGYTEKAVQTYLLTLDLTTGEKIKKVYDPFKIMKEATIRPPKRDRFKS
jgi:hypothetical protein